MITAVLGGGQLARMLALAGAPLGLRTRCLDPSPDSVAGHVSELIVAGDLFVWTNFSGADLDSARRVMYSVSRLSK